MKAIPSIVPNVENNVTQGAGYVIYKPNSESFLITSQYTILHKVIHISWSQNWEDSHIFQSISSIRELIIEHTLVRHPSEDVTDDINFTRYTKPEIYEWAIIKVIQNITFPPQPKSHAYRGISNYTSLDWRYSINIGDELKVEEDA